MKPSTNIQDLQARRLEERVVLVCDRMGTFIEWWGFRAVNGRVWALLAIRARPCSQAEISRTLGISKALVSSAIGELSGHGLVRRVGTGRLAPWTANMDVWPVITDVLRGREWMMIEEVRVALESALDEAEQLEREGEIAGEWSLSRLRVLYVLTDMAQHVLRMIISLRSGGERTGARRTFKLAANAIRLLRQANSSGDAS